MRMTENFIWFQNFNVKYSMAKTHEIQSNCQLIYVKKVALIQLCVKNASFLFQAVLNSKISQLLKIDISARPKS